MRSISVRMSMCKHTSPTLHREQWRTLVTSLTLILVVLKRHHTIVTVTHSICLTWWSQHRARETGSLTMWLLIEALWSVQRSMLCSDLTKRCSDRKWSDSTSSANRLGPKSYWKSNPTVSQGKRNGTLSQVCHMISTQQAPNHNSHLKEL